MDADNRTHRCTCQICQPVWGVDEDSDAFVPQSKREPAKRQEDTEKVTPVALKQQFATG